MSLWPVLLFCILCLLPCIVKAWVSGQHHHHVFAEILLWWSCGCDCASRRGAGYAWPPLFPLIVPFTVSIPWSLGERQCYSMLILVEKEVCVLVMCSGSPSAHLKVISYQDNSFTSGSPTNTQMCFAVAQMSGDQGLSAANCHAAQALLRAPAIPLESIVYSVSFGKSLSSSLA